MKKETIIEAATYIIVFSAITVVSPMLGKFIDKLYFPYPKWVTESFALLLVGSVVALTGVALVAWTIYLFKIKGGGTPNPKLPPKVLIIRGPYKYTRNPMALGGLFTLIGEAIIYYSPSLLGIAILYGIIVYLNAMLIEEPELKKRFGTSYEAYLKEIPRFFPKLF